jgi:hypothetical protein
MATVLAYVDAVPGRLYPLVPTLQELVLRGHRVALRCGVDELDRMRAAGLAPDSLTPEIERFEPQDWRARTRFGALRSGLGQFGERARFQVPDLRAAVEARRPDVLLIDESAWGAAAAAERSGLPWAFTVVSRCRCLRATRHHSGSASPRGMTSSAVCATGWLAGSRSARSSTCWPRT